MSFLPPLGDASLAAADLALVNSQEKRFRSYLGMSQIGAECSRQLFYSFRQVQRPAFDAATLKRFADGHASELVAVARLGEIEGIELHAVDDAGEQFGFKDLGGHFSGHMDGVILGLLQAPKTWHVLEIKASAKWADLDKAKKKFGDKNALREWNATYYAQAVLYMDYAGLDRHYTVVVSPGAREWTSVRTDADPAHAAVLKAKAERIIFTDTAPDRIGDSTNFKCRWCDFANICHEGDMAERNCRTCMNAEVLREGGWRCAQFGHELDKAAQELGCEHHRFLPSLVPGEQIDAGPWGVKYNMGGSEWVDAGPECVA
ncbi:MAG: oxidoreductase [Pseudomonadota bacterium]